MFHDRARIFVAAGRGGDGSMSFRREYRVPKGGPDGGDGGRGGDVVLIADPDLRDLSPLPRGRRFKAGRGGHGPGANKRGAAGETVELRVPVGTQVLRRRGDGRRRPGRAPARARGRRGRLRGAREQAVRVADAADAALCRDRDAGRASATLELRLKLLADAALAGLPNAGKSSLLRRISNAQPKVAEYPFTTLAPVLGTVDAPDGRQLTVADVPGLIEGASEGIGLGHEFLAHLERARLLVHVIDAARGDPAERFETIDARARRLRRGPRRAPADRRAEQARPARRSRRSWRSTIRASLRVLAVSCATGAGIDELRRALFELVPAAARRPADEDDGSSTSSSTGRSRQRGRYRILRTDRGFRVVGTPPGGEELEDALRAAGARKGAEVEVGDEILEFA